MRKMTIGQSLAVLVFVVLIALIGGDLWMRLQPGIGGAGKKQVTITFVLCASTKGRVTEDACQPATMLNYSTPYAMQTTAGNFDGILGDTQTGFSQQLPEGASVVAVTVAGISFGPPVLQLNHVTADRTVYLAIPPSLRLEPTDTPPAWTPTPISEG